TEKQVLDEISRFGPELTIVHTTTPSIYNDIDYARNAKKIAGSTTVLVGAHVSVLSEETLRVGKDAVDIIVRGEAEYTLRDIAKGLAWEKIPGIAFRSDDGKIITTSDRPPLDVNELPFPAWHHIDPRWYRDAGKLYPFLTLFSGRGCFAKCTFCRETQVVNGRKLRFRDAAKVVDEIEYDLRCFPYLQEIMIETDTFTALPEHVRSFCKEFMRRGLHKKIRWSCNVRVDIDLTLLPLMKKAGCRMLMIGFEFGTNEQLNVVKKGTTIEMGRAFAQAAARLGFTLHGCFMIGAPFETRESAQKTIDFAKSLPLDTIQVSGIAVYPGTELYDWARSHGYIVAKDWTDWVDENREQVTLLSYPQMSKKEIDYFVDKGLKEFYMRPKQILKMFFAIRSWDDVRRKYYGLVSYLDYFKSNKRLSENPEAGVQGEGKPELTCR
ncbi:MAG: radical SAM protein, partial [Oligoflexales bacterium]|nr:radical SAM protein [Oligoflexales bacterium]